jgi:dihydrodipicolinate synthase/N-acetylneuraminate lyase
MALGGVIAALVTPYSGYGGIDTDGVGRLVENAVAGGVEGVLVNAPVGEGPHLSRGERIFVFEAAVEAAEGRVPVYAATGAVSTEETLALTWDAGKAGVAAAFVATPFYYPLPQAALIEHYRYLARRGRLPLVPVSDPAAVGNALDAATLAELATIEGIAGVAVAGGDIMTLRAGLAAVGGHRPVLAARDGLLPEALAAGVGGVVSVLAGVLPGEVVALAREVREGDRAGGEARWARLRPLVGLLDDPATGVAAGKAAAAALGLPGGAPRSPLPGAEARLVEAIGEALAVVGAGG